MSGSDDSTNSSSCSATATWSSSASEMNDKTGELPNTAAWMGGLAKRTRASSESESTGMSAWFGGSMRERSGSTGGWGSAGGGGLAVWGFGQPRVRRSSSKDVEEAMACGMSKTEIFMPPM